MSAYKPIILTYIYLFQTLPRLILTSIYFMTKPCITEYAFHISAKLEGSSLGISEPISSLINDDDLIQRSSRSWRLVPSSFHKQNVAMFQNISANANVEKKRNIGVYSTMNYRQSFSGWLKLCITRDLNGLQKRWRLLQIFFSLLYSQLYLTIIRVIKQRDNIVTPCHIYRM